MIINSGTKIIFLFVLSTSIFFSKNDAIAQTILDVAPQSRQDGWAVAKPSEVGFNPVKLANLTKLLQSGDIHNVHSVIVEHEGKLVYEEYFSGPDQRWGSWGKSLDNVIHNHEKLHDLRSVSKSVTSAILGIALAGKHREALNKPILSYLPYLKGKVGNGVQKVTLKHVLTMTAGLEWNEMEESYTSNKNDEIRMSYTNDPVAMVLARDIRDPVGSKWYYNGGLTQVLGGVITNLTGMPLDKYAEKSLFHQLGINHYEWLGEQKWGSPSAASGLRMRARDLAKIGSVYLNQGKWNEKQIIPADWIELSSKRHVESIPWGKVSGDYGYGFMWYPGVTNDGSNHRIVRASGNGDQKIYLLPELKLNITVFVGNYNDWTHNSSAKILKAVLAARE